MVPTDRKEPPEHENPVVLYDRATEVNTAEGYSGEITTKLAIKTRDENGQPATLTFNIDVGGGGVIIRSTVITGTGENEGRVLDRQVVNGGPKIASCYDVAWSLIDERQWEHPDVRFQLLDGQEVREWDDSVARKEMLKGADMVTVIGEASGDPRSVYGVMHFGAYAGIARHTRRFTCFLEDTGVPRKIRRGSGDLNILDIPDEAQTSTWAVTRFVLEDGPAETTPLGDGLWDK